MKIVYIAGPYTGATMIEVEENILKSKVVALRLAEWRIPFLSPVCHSAHFEQYLAHRDPGYQFWINMTLELLKRCDAVFLVQGWERSRGATGEFNYAREHNLPVFSEYDELLDWWSEQERS